MAIRKRTNSYWRKRAEERMLLSEKQSLAYQKKIERIYLKAQREVLKELVDLYDKYYDKSIGFKKQLLDMKITYSDMRKLTIKIEQLKLKDKLPENYKGRITRLEKMSLDIWAEIHKAGIKHERVEERMNRKIFSESYYKSGYDISRGIGSTPVSFTTLDRQTIEQVINAKFNGMNYSERIWRNTDILANQLKERLVVAVATGQGIEKTSREFRERFGVQKYYTERLVRTETNYFHNAGEVESYRKLGFEYFTFIATLDNRTSEICAEMDGKTFKMTEAEAGLNVPPLHPNCRSTIAAAFKGFEPETRRYRDPETGKNKYYYNVPYNIWRKEIENLVKA